jgi:hypothetical protein
VTADIEKSSDIKKKSLAIYCQVAELDWHKSGRDKIRHMAAAEIQSWHVSAEIERRSKRPCDEING